MIERVITTLQVLSTARAGDALHGSQQQSFHDWLVNVGQDYSDAYRLLADCPQVQLSTRQALALEKLDGLLADLEGAGTGVSADAGESSAAHARVLAAARNALLTLDLREHAESTGRMQSAESRLFNHDIRPS
ncbi:MAG TPA: hypothetical protein VKZ41_13590 [Gemmatimonadales bacterium]|nr:hypothetical protein [Gemmatimonadales bacterium]